VTDDVTQPYDVIVGGLNLQDLRLADKKEQRLKKQGWKMTDQIEGLEAWKTWYKFVIQ